MADELTLTKNSSGNAVLKLQQALTSIGFDAGKIDGNFGPKTEAGVRAFQKAVGLPDDGIVSPQTWNALLRPSAAGIQDLLLYRDPENPYRRHLISDCIPPHPSADEEGDYE